MELTKEQLWTIKLALDQYLDLQEYDYEGCDEIKKGILEVLNVVEAAWAAASTAERQRSIDELKAKFGADVTYVDVVAAVLYEVSKKLDVLPGDGAFLHEAFRRMKIEVPSLFLGFIFDESGPSSFCDQLDVALSTLSVSNMIEINKKKLMLYDRIAMQRSAEKLESRRSELEKCAEIFIRELYGV